jgi:S1-C subfamily serine protease
MAVICLFFLIPHEAFAKDPTDSVVKVFVTANPIDYYRPWQSIGVQSSAGSGAIIAGNRILTNAHVISDYTFIQVKKNDDPKKYAAVVEAIGYDCDLALLRVDDPDFFKGTTGLELGELVRMRDAVTVLGYPQGGDKLSVTEGVVSRIELTSYSQSGRKLLTVQIDAAINPGNSGGPVIQKDKLAGIAMQVLQDGQNIGYMIPPPVIRHFLDDLKDGAYNGFPVMGIDFATTENEALRQLYGIEKLDGGVLITHVLPHSPAYGQLQRGDVILSVDGVAIGEDGTFAFRLAERLAMPHLITMKQAQEIIGLNIVREGKRMDVRVALTDFTPLVPYPNQFDKPPFYIYGGMVFTVLSADLLKAWGNQWWEKAPLDFNYYLISSGRMNRDDKKEIVVLLSVLPDQINVGYHEQGNQVIKSVNGQEFSSFKDFVLLLNRIKTTEKYTVLVSEQNSEFVLRNEQIDEATAQILERNNIAVQYSESVGQWLREAGLILED